MKNEFPIARFEGIVVQELKDEVLICDLKSNKVFCLNQTAGEVWKLCDGKTNTIMMAEILRGKLKAKVNEDVVLFSLGELSEKNLLTKKITVKENFPGFSRREVIKKIGLTSMVALPLITSIGMPSAAQAQSTVCTSDLECAGGECCDLANQICVPSGSDGCSCFGCFQCNSRCCMSGICQDNSLPICSTNATCGQTLACPSGFTCCNPGSVTNMATCSTCFC